LDVEGIQPGAATLVIPNVEQRFNDEAWVCSFGFWGRVVIFRKSSIRRRGKRVML
jgi:hypothetical protein